MIDAIGYREPATPRRVALVRSYGNDPIDARHTMIVDDRGRVVYSRWYRSRWIRLRDWLRLQVIRAWWCFGWR